MGITACAAVAVLGLGTAGFGGWNARALAERGPTAAELSAAAATGAAQRWEREPASALFPATIKYTTDLQTSEKATRVLIGTSSACASGTGAALDATLRSLAVKYGCVAAPRATYIDALGGSVYTVSVLAFPSASAAADFDGQLPTDPYPAAGLRAMPVPGTAAARFDDAARQAAASQQTGPYVVLAVAGYADGRPARSSGERRDTVFDPVSQIVSAVAAPLDRQIAVRCGNGEFTCLAGAAPNPPSPGQVRPYVMSMLGQIGVPAAWNVTKGGGVTVAVLDTGVNTDAPDLQGVVTTGPDYAAGADPAGYVPPHQHGTYIASIIAGRGSGPGASQGIIGVAPAAKILSVRVILDDVEPGFGAYQNDPKFAKAIGEGIYYAVAHGAQVINLSLGSGQPTGYLRAAVAYALDKGVVVVASAGNDGSGSGFAPYIYPASFSGVIAVAATTTDGGRASFSEQNASVVIGAPGVGVVGDVNSLEYMDGDGTSPAAAMVSGVAALIKSKYPGLSPALVEQALIESATHQPAGGYDVYKGFGELSASGALTAAGRLAGKPPARGLPAQAGFTGEYGPPGAAGTGASGTGSAGTAAAGPGPIEVVHRDMAAVTGYSALGGGGLLVALGALVVLVVLARRKPKPASAGASAAAGMPDLSTWQPEAWTTETWRRDDSPGGT
jgi:hypothetical protein